VILDHVRLLSSHPHKVVVTELQGDPITFEIRVCKDELGAMLGKAQVIHAVCCSLAGLKAEQFHLKFLVCECL